MAEENYIAGLLKEISESLTQDADKLENNKLLNNLVAITVYDLIFQVKMLTETVKILAINQRLIEVVLGLDDEQNS